MGTQIKIMKIINEEEANVILKIRRVELDKVLLLLFREENNNHRIREVCFKFLCSALFVFFCCCVFQVVEEMPTIV